MYKIVSDSDERFNNGENVNRMYNVYLHGESERVWGFDICNSFGKTFPIDSEKSKKAEITVFKKGIYNCGLLDDNLELIPCVAFIWQSNNRSMGMIVTSEDADSYQTAFEHYKKESSRF